VRLNKWQNRTFCNCGYLAKGIHIRACKVPVITISIMY